MKKTIKFFIKYIFNQLLNLNFTRPLLNYFIENSSDRVRHFFISNVDKPKKNIIWKSKLLNNKYISIPVNKDDRSWHLSYTYKNHNIGLSNTEKIIHDYYPLKAAYFDVGANLGLRTLYAMNINRKTILFEPNTDLHNHTRSVYKANNYTNYEIMPVCLSNFTGKTSFFVSLSSYTSSMNKENVAINKYDNVSKEISADVLTLDSFLDSRPDLKPCFIKIDAEGEDFNVILGGEKYITANLPAIIIEVTKPEYETQVRDYADKIGYTCFGIFPSQLNCLIPLIPEKSTENKNFNDILLVNKKDSKLLQKLNTIIKTT